jgi:heptosyltransferase-2
MSPPPVPAGGFRRIAIVRLSSLGDVVLTLPVVHALRSAYPSARVHYWVKEEFAELVRDDPAIDHVRVLEPDARRIEDLVSMSAEFEDHDLIVDLHGNLRARVLTFRQKALVLRAPSYRWRRLRWVHARWSRPAPLPRATERYAAALAPLRLGAPGPPRVTVAAAMEAWSAEWVAAFPGDAPLVALCPGARHATKRWPERHWVELFTEVRKAGRRVVCLSLAAERAALPELAARVEADSAARWVIEPIGRMAALLTHCAQAVSGDSGLMHLAAARGTAVVAMFGSTSPVLGFAPNGEGHRVLCREEPCQPCTLHGRPQCPKGHFRCMEALTPGHVLEVLGRGDA